MAVVPGVYIPMRRPARPRSQLAGSKYVHVYIEPPESRGIIGQMLDLITGAKARIARRCHYCGCANHDHLGRHCQFCRAELL